MTDSESSPLASAPQLSPPKISVLFVCLGNICRSPMAEAVFRSLTNNLPRPPPLSSSSEAPLSRTSTPMPNSSAATTPHPQIATIDSAGTGAYHTLEPPDPRTMATLHTHNINGYTHGARKITVEDFEEFDYILAMDRANLRNLKAMKAMVERKGDGVASRSEVKLFGEFNGEAKAEGKRGVVMGGEEVVDPYYGADDGFEVVYEQVERLGRAFLREVVEQKEMKGEELVDGEVP